MNSNGFRRIPAEFRNSGQFLWILTDSGQFLWNPSEFPDSGGFRRNLWRTEKYCPGRGIKEKTWAACGYHAALLFSSTQGGKEGKHGRCVDITPPHCLGRRPVGERRKTWAACGYHAAPVVFVDARRGERRKTGAACGYHVAPLSSSTSGGRRRKTGAVCGLHTAPLLLLPLRLLDLLAPPRSSLPTPFVPSTPPRPPPAPHASSTSRRRP